LCWCPSLLSDKAIPMKVGRHSLSAGTSGQRLCARSFSPMHSTVMEVENDWEILAGCLPFVL